MQELAVFLSTSMQPSLQASHLHSWAAHQFVCVHIPLKMHVTYFTFAHHGNIKLHLRSKLKVVNGKFMHYKLCLL